MVTLNQIKPSEAGNKENYWIMVLLYFASFLVGLGIVAEVAANWQNIPDAVKLGGALVVMLINAGAIWWTMKADKPILKQVLCCVYAFLIMGVIGLIGQVFHLHANAANACFLWALISWPLIFISPRLLWLWTPLFFFGCRYMPYMVNEMVSEGVFGDAGNIPPFYRFDNAILNVLRTYLAFVFILAYEVWMNFADKNNKTILRPLRCYSGLFLLGMYGSASFFAHLLPKIDAARQMGAYFEFALPIVITAGLVYALNCKMKRKSFMPLFLIGILLQNMYIYFFYKHSSFWSDWFGAEEYLPIVFCVLIWIYALYNHMSKLAKLAVFSIILWFVFTFGDHVYDIIPSLIVCAVITGCAYFRRNRKWFNTGIILAVLRILVYYGNVENLQHLGLYLIGSGVLLIATTLLLTKYSKIIWEKKDEK